jgi:hypothetical protein
MKVKGLFGKLISGTGNTLREHWVWLTVGGELGAKPGCRDPTSNHACQHSMAKKDACILRGNWCRFSSA